MEPTRTGLLFTVDVSTWSPAQIKRLQQAVAGIDAAGDADEARSIDQVRSTDRVRDIEVWAASKARDSDGARIGDGWTAPRAADLSWTSPDLELRVDDNYGDATLGWQSRAALLELITRLQAGGYDTQAWALRTCLDNGGSIRRSEILQRLGKDAEATLRGWTRPLNRIVEEMRSSGSIGRGAALPLAPQFVGEDGRADYFVTPDPLVRLWFQMGQS